LVEAASILQRQGHDVTVRIIGEGPELPRIIRLSGLLGVNVEYQHFLSRYDYLELLSTSSFLVNPSQYEAFSIVVAEAKTIGLPVIISLPWGETFKDLPNVKLVNGSSATEIAEAAVETVSQQRTKTGSIMPWREVTKKLIEEVFRPSLSRKDY